VLELGCGSARVVSGLPAARIYVVNTFFIMKEERLMLFTEIIAVYSEKCVKHINTLLEKEIPNLAVQVS